MKLLYVCDADSGGIAEYAILQAASLADCGAQVIFLCHCSFPLKRLNGCIVLPLLPISGERGFLLYKAYKRVVNRRSIAQIVVQAAEQFAVDAILMACYSEFLSPFWASPYSLLARKGVPIGTIAHDPVRDFVIGPGWWHSWSVRTAYSFVRDVFVHDDTAIDFGGPQPESIRVHQIPIGPYPVPPASSCRHKIRSDMGFEPSDRIFLSFGQIRDGKNIDRFIRILPQLPADVKLLIVGSSGGNSQRPLIYYQRLAIDTGVSERCVWDIRFVPDDELGNIFLAADFLLLTYSAKFRSASGVMSAAATVGLTLLASSGPSPLKTAVLEYGLGVFVEPDDDGEILAGALRLLSCTTISPDWERYSRDHSWQENARRVIQALS